MWWPGPELGPNFWTEAHNSPGATVTGTRWALAEGEVGGAQSAETYILIANTSAASGSARVTLYFEDGGSAEKTFALLPRSRTNVNVSSEFPNAAGRRFGAVIESLGATPAQIVVERAIQLLPRSRTNVNVSGEFPNAAGRRFGTVIESLGATPAQIVVERAMYTSPGGVTWAAGTNALATRLP